MKKLFRFRYPKITLLAVFIVLAYILFSNAQVSNFVQSMNNLSYLGAFIAGILFAFGFTVPFAIGFFVTLHPANPIIYAIIAGIGAMISNLLIFSFIKISFMDEFYRLEKTKPIMEVREFINKEFHGKIKIYLIYAFAGFIIASPISDEIAVIMLAGLTHIKERNLAIISFILSTIGIWILLSL